MVAPAESGSPTLVVYYHPSRDSLNRAVLERVEAGADEDVSVFHLHDGDRPTDAELSEAETLILVYPTWWGGLPGLLLDWVHGVFAPSIDAGAASPIPRVRRFVAVSTHGSPSYINRLQGGPGRRLLRRLVRVCAPGAAFEWRPFYSVDTSTEERRAEFLDECVGLTLDEESPK